MASIWFEGIKSNINIYEQNYLGSNKTMKGCSFCDVICKLTLCFCFQVSRSFTFRPAGSGSRSRRWRWWTRGSTCQRRSSAGSGATTRRRTLTTPRRGWTRSSSAVKTRSNMSTIKQISRNRYKSYSVCQWLDLKQGSQTSGPRYH